MSNNKKQYFLAPSWDYPPDSTIKLGNIILSPSRPVPPLVSASQVAAQVSSSKHEVEWTREKMKSHKFGIWTKFVEFLGVNVGVDVASTVDDTFCFKTMSTEEFYPDDDFVVKALSSPIALRSLKQRKSLYVIVGVKTVSGAVVKRSQSKHIGGDLNVSVDATLAGSLVPISVGPFIKEKSGNKESLSFGGSDDFVFAFRVHKLSMKEPGDVRQESFIRGALFGLPDNEIRPEKPVVAAGVDCFEASDEKGKWNDAEIEDEDEDLQVFIPVRS